MPRLSLAFALVASFFTPLSLHAAEPKAPAGADAELVRTAKGMLANLRSETLPNGLRVYLLPIPNSPTVSTMVAYRVGSADEEKDQTGLSHYLEHLLFKGTDKLMPGDIDRATQRNGGRNNAYTNEDMTVYHFDFAADRWETALEIEADRMRNVRIDAKHEFEQEKGAVIAELKRNEDGPWDLEFKKILTLLYPKEAPYSHPVIGQDEHVRAATAEIIKRYYDKWYYPNNASLVVAGGFDPEKAMAKIQSLFGSIPRGDLPARKEPRLFKDREGPVRQQFESKFELPRLLVGFNTCQVGNADDPVLDIISTILSDGRTARLYRKLVEGERVATSAGAGNYTGRYPGWFAVHVEGLQGKDRNAIEELVLAETEKLASAPVSDEELKRARRKLLASYVFDREDIHRFADSLARASAYPAGENVAKYYGDYLDRLLAVSKDDIQKVAKKYFSRKQAALVWSVPPDEKKGAASVSRESKTSTRRLAPASQSGDGAGAASFSLKEARRVVLPNGLTLVLLEDHRAPIVVARASVRDVTLREPAEKAGIASLVGSLLEEGTENHTGPEIAALIENTGGSLGFGSSGAALRVLTPDTDLGLALLFECLTRPSFPQDAFDRLKEQQLAEIADSDAQPRSKASRLFREIVYGPHPYGRSSSGKKETVEKLTVADCKAFHKTAFVPDATIVVVVGDFNADTMAKKIEGLTKDWKKSGAAAPTPPAPPKAATVVEKIVSDGSAAQVHVYIGHVGITRKDPDYYKLLVMDNVLGTGPGFTDRLSSTLRDRQGLAYTVSAAISSSAGNEPGTFTGYIGTFPDKFIWVRDGFFKEINRIRDEPPTKEEVESAKKYLLGSLPFRFTTLSSVASQLLAIEEYGLGFDYLEKFRAEVAAVTPEDVQAVARKHLHPKAIAVVAVGPIDAEGKPLVKKGTGGKDQGTGSK
jgi:zinc protease